MARAHRLELALCAIACLSCLPSSLSRSLMGQSTSDSLNFTAPLERVLYSTGIPQMLNWGSVFNIPFLTPAPSAAPPSPSASRNEAGTTCPPPGYSPLSPFDLESFITGYWYTQEQSIVSFSPKETLYCMSSHYVPINEFSERVPFKKTGGNFIDLRNYANYGKVNGQPFGTSGSGSNTPLNFINGLIFFKEVATTKPGNDSIVLGAFYPAGGIVRSILNTLGLIQLFQAPFGELWIVDAGPGKAGEPNFKGYEWAILTTGPPNTPSNGACAGPNFGYWLFSRAPVASPDLIAQMRKVGAAKGLDNSILLPVQQEGCLYDQRT